MGHRNQLQHYKKSTFPPLLNTYQALPGRTEGDENQKQMIKDKKRQKSNNQPTLHEVDKEEVMKQALLEQRHHETYKNLQKLKNAMYAHHKDLLNKKVQEQRIKIQMSDLRFKQVLEHQRRKKIIGLQNELIRQGILKNQQDYEDFWTLILEGSHNTQLKEKLQAVKSKMIALKSSPSHVHGRSSATKLTKALLNKRYGQLKKNSEAVLGSASCQPPIYHPSKHMKPQEETEQIFPKMLLSWLSKLQKNPEEQSRTWEVTKTWKRNRKHYEHERRLIYLHHMYYLALINMKLSKRLLEKNGQFAVTEQEYDVCDLMDYLFPNRHKQPGTSPTEREQRENVLPVLMRKKQQEQHHRGPSKMSRVFKGLRNGSEQKQDEDRGVTEVLKDQKSNVHVLPEMIPVPLTLEDVVLKNRVVEAKSAVTYWINYADKEEAIS
ncbi:PREDICTED: uncharacterized protein LOC109304855 isoform X2 [Gavialis gangeticus]|uniref:uncharacterized protein LOC109304855 isoform X2 n=1 Tax=Gavialis gangeticus TaxID=94835 RepID=UPI00092E3B70|nr:PREDICTED: uncharacterized protein LOC109304855 isoform X2 [Gavialis gangeticus]